MYETYFNLNQRPFAAVPRVDHYFPAATSESARTTLARCIERAEGTGLLIGPSGTGKTLLCQVLAVSFATSFQVVLLTGGHLSNRRALLQAILYELGQPYRDMDEGELRLALVDHLTLSEECDRGVVLLVDEAHSLPLRLLDEIRMLTNLIRQGQPAVRLVLAGGRGLEERFASPKLESFSQRVAARCYLESIDRSETQQYIHARIAATGGNAPQIFPVESCQSVHKATDGVPRLINQVCDHVMLLAYTAGRRQIEPSNVEEAWADLQQLPTPWNEPARSAASGVVEFGRLDDEPDGQARPSEAVEVGSPKLRISPESDETSLGDDVDPAERIHQIERMLSGTEDDFHPVGSTGPEVELVFDDPTNPFRERFDEEEVVTDRYAPAEAAAQASTQPAAGPTTVPLRREIHNRHAEVDDSDMIIIEEGCDDSSPWPNRAVVAVHRQEYGRLFAKLRQGAR